MAQRLVRAAKRAVYLARGKKPLSTGYGVYKEDRIVEILAAGAFDPEHLEPGYGVGLDERIVEYPWLFSRLPPGPGRLLDAGSVLNFDYLLTHPTLRAKQIFISTLAPESPRQQMRPNVSYVYEDLRETCYRDGYFDWVVCISTLEHVGLDNTRFYTSDQTRREASPDDYLRDVGELRRVIRPGGVLYLSVPFGRHRDHGWLQVFDATMVDRALAGFQPATCVERHFRYERDGWRLSSREASREATYFDYHAARHHDPDSAAAARAVVCLELDQ
jgi:SAM-dependent methyltransferase